MLYALFNRFSTRNNPQPVIAELIGSETCAAEGLTSCGSSPVLELCRLLVERGFDPNRPLHVYRGDHKYLALVVAGIGVGAQLEVNGRGTSFAKRPVSVGTASPKRKTAGRGHPCPAAVAGMPP